jgi:uncharacterized protein (TIGR03435 family)
VRSLYAAVFAIVGLTYPPPGCAQTQTSPPASPHFEVASVKPSSPGGRGGRSGPTPGGQRYLATNTPLKILITEAYQVKLDQVVGGPDWIDRDRYDVNAKAERTSTTQELRSMLQELLAGRFKLQFHRETKSLSAYIMIVDKSGVKLRSSDAANAAFSFEQSPGQPHQVKMRGTSVPMDYLAWRLGRVLDLPVIDRTNLKGEFDFDLAFMEEVPPDVAERALMNGRPIDSHPSLFEALRKQLGLRLESRREPIEVIVIDYAEKPDEN